jgi:NADH dehydrogenase FAD-containing subunit
VSTDHLIGSPLAFASTEYAAKAWIKFGDIPGLQTPAVRWVHGRVVTVDCQKRAAAIQEAEAGLMVQEEYDYLIAASGLRRTWPTVPTALTKENYMAQMTAHVHGTQEGSDGVVVVGGGTQEHRRRPPLQTTDARANHYVKTGAVGIEMAAELKLVQPQRRVTLIHSRTRLLSSEPLPEDLADRALFLLHDAGVKTVMGRRVTLVADAVSPGSPVEITLDNGERLKASFVINAISKFTPTSSYLPPAALEKEGYVKIRPK